MDNMIENQDETCQGEGRGKPKQKAVVVKLFRK